MEKEKIKKSENLMFQFVDYCEMEYAKGSAIESIWASEVHKEMEETHLKIAISTLANMDTLGERSTMAESETEKFISSKELDFMIGKIVHEAVCCSKGIPSENMIIHLENIIELAQRKILALAGDYNFIPSEALPPKK